MTRFFVVTSTLNAEHLIDETVLSVLSQAGNFDLHYHVQDGGSEDGTIERLKLWSKRLRGDEFPTLCSELRFTFARQPDNGLYQGLNRAFRFLNGHDDDFMSWVNAGDRLESGALATVTSAADDFPDIVWVNGLLAQCTNFGGLLMVGMVSPVNARKTVAAGLHDGTHFGFMQQEGTFWRRKLWQSAGGHLNESLRLAGDFDLWRRFASISAPLRIHGVLGVFRHHAGRLVANPRDYLTEVNSLFDETSRSKKRDMWRQYERLRKAGDPKAMEEAGFYGERIVWDRRAAGWRRERRPIGVRARLE